MVFCFNLPEKLLMLAVISPFSTFRNSPGNLPARPACRFPGGNVVNYRSNLSHQNGIIWILETSIVFPFW